MTDHKQRTSEMIAVMQAYVDGERIEAKVGVEWQVFETPIWAWFDTRYRIAAPTPDTINWDHVSSEFICIARDKSGVPKLHTGVPNPVDGVWFNHSGIALSALYFASYTRGTCDWHDSLVMRPGCESDG